MKTKKQSFCKALFLKIALLTALILGGGGNSAWADELTINDTGTTTNAGVPFSSSNLQIAGLYANGQFIIPASLISNSINGGDITKITLYVSQGTTFKGATHVVYLKEVDYSVFPSTAFVEWASMTSVFTGELTVSDSKVEVSFTSSFNYNGGNLLIGFKHASVATANPSPAISWTVVSTSQNTAMTGTTYGTNVAARQFLPKITFTYELPASNTISASPNAAAAFGEVYEDASKVYTITNNGTSAITVTPSITGTNSSEFSVSPSEATEIAAGGSQDFTFSFNYNSGLLGSKSATLTFEPSDGEYNTINISASATAISNDNPELSVTPDEGAAFGSVRANDSKTYTVTNSGTGSMTVDIASSNSTEFSVSKTQMTLGAGESSTFNVTFNFNAERSGDRSATITVTPTYDEDDAVSISATATAITQPILGISSTDCEFGNMKVNGSRQFTVSNTGYGDMEVNISSSNETFFSVSPSTLIVGQDESETFTINFNYDPSSLGSKSGTITVTPTYDEDDKKTITATATAIEPMFVSPSTDTNFGIVTGNASRTFTVTNLGNSNMNVTIENSNTTEFSVSETSFAAIPAGKSQEFTVTFNYDSNAVGSQTSTTISVTPNSSSSEDEKIQFNVNATPQASSYEVTLFDEDEATEWTSGYAEAKVKYSAKSGWNTFCVPFQMNGTNMDYVFGSGCKFYTLKSYNASTSVLTFTSASTLSAGVPAIVYTESAPVYSDGVILTNRYLSSTKTPGSNTSGGATFRGTYVTKTYETDDNWYGVTPSGMVMQAGSGASVKGYRAYFTGVSAPAAGARVSIAFDSGEEGTTDLGFVKMVDENAKDIYTLSGQKVQKGGKGIYIVNGRKVVIK